MFANLKSQVFALHVIFMFSGNHASLFCLKIAWVVAKLWWYKIWLVESSYIHSRQKSINSYTCILWDVITRGVINSMCSALVIHTLKFYRTSFYFLPFLFIKKTIEFFHNLPNFRCSYRWTFFVCNHWIYQLDICTTAMRRISSIPFSLHVILWICSSSWKMRKFDVVNYLMLYNI